MTTKANPALRELRLDASRRIAAYARAGKTDLAPDIEATDLSFFLSPEIYAREHQKLFRETPLLACFSTDLAEPGSYRLFEETGLPIVVMRGKDGVVRAFLNICGHRGARLVRQDCGKAARFTCRFHGWTYDTAGQVIGVPEEAQFCGKIDAQKHLIPVPAEERHGLVFVQATPNGTMDLDAHLGAFDGVLKVLDLAQATCVIEEKYRARSNWKYTLDTYFENYHLPVLHRESFAHVFAHNLNIFEAFGPHHYFIFPHATIYDWMNKPEAEWPIDALPLTYFLFPNTNIAIGSASPNGSLISVHRLFPQGVGELVTRVGIYAPYGVQSPDHRAEIEKTFASMKRAVQEEDYAVTGEAYRHIATLPRKATFPVGRHEIGVQNFHRNVRRIVGA